jgi:hypothetical protein
LIIDIEAVLRAHSHMRLERPPLLWSLSADDEAFFRLLGETISHGLTRGNEVGDLTLNASNTVVGPTAPLIPGTTSPSPSSDPPETGLRSNPGRSIAPSSTPTCIERPKAQT